MVWFSLLVPNTGGIREFSRRCSTKYDRFQ